MIMRCRFRLLLTPLLMLQAIPALAELQVGATVVDVSPPNFPVLVNGGFASRSATKIHTPVSARAIVLDDGQERLAIVVVDSCMLPRPLLDDAKQLAARRTQIQPQRMLISATHTHTAPSCMGALGTDADTAYISFLREKLAEAIAQAEANLRPASVGFGSGDAAPYTALRRWIRRSDRVVDDPFGNPTVRANMHAANNWDDVVGPSGPEDPELSVIAFQSLDGQPIAVLANFSMHYFGDQPISADYFGLFCNAVQTRLSAGATPAKDALAPVALMSHGCSGDIWRRDYSLPPEEREELSINEYTERLVEIAMQAYQQIEYDADATLAMAERRLPLRYRVPDAGLLQWARQRMEQFQSQAQAEGQLPTSQADVYAREQILLHEMQATEVVVQAVRIGDIAIATTPNETYAITGLKLKLQSPLRQTMVIELANGGDGYIPPPEQHRLGGYNTWPARSAGLEISAEPKITAAALELLEQVTQQPRRVHDVPLSDAAEEVLRQKPLAFWRLDELSGPHARDTTPQHRDAVYEPGVVFFLDGPPLETSPAADARNRAAHFAGGRLRARMPEVGDSYSVDLWIWNGMPNDARDTTGWFFSRDHDRTLSAHGDHLGIGGTATKPGCLIFQQGRGVSDGSGGAGQGSLHVGNTPLTRWSWNRVTLVRDGEQVQVYLNGAAKPEIEAKVDRAIRAPSALFFFGGRSDNEANLEGKLDEIALFGHPLPAPDESSAAGPYDQR